MPHQALTVLFQDSQASPQETIEAYYTGVSGFGSYK